MATRESKRVMQLRERNYKQVNFLAPHGTKLLLQAIARKEKCTSSDVIRRAILARAGLEKMPDDANLAKLAATETSREAADALIDCQTVEYVERQLIRQGRPLPAEKTPVVMLSSKWYKEESLAALEAVKNDVERQNTMQKPRTFEITRRNYDALCRLLANAVVIDCDDM